jgi:hypothetical protein
VLGKGNKRVGEQCFAQNFLCEMKQHRRGRPYLYECGCKLSFSSSCYGNFLKHNIHTTFQCLVSACSVLGNIYLYLLPETSAAYCQCKPTSQLQRNAIAEH